MPSKFDISFSPPILNAAGFLGFAPDPHGLLDLKTLGAFITNPISLEPRSPAAGTRFLPFSGCFLLHSGYPNPGLKTILRRCASRWKRSPLPVWVHLLVQTPSDASAMLRHLEALEGVAGIELGLPPGIDLVSAQAVIQAARGELPLVVKIPLDQAQAMAALAKSNGADAISLSPRRGALPDSQGKLTQGRLYGPALFPQALLIMKTVADCGLPVIAAGGVYTAWQAQAMLDGGAIAVQLDGVLWKEPDFHFRGVEEASGRGDPPTKFRA